MGQKIHRSNFLKQSSFNFRFFGAFREKISNAYLNQGLIWEWVIENPNYIKNNWISSLATMVGLNWEANPELPVAFCYNFSPWKFGFFTDYVPGSRLAFFSRRFFWLRSFLFCYAVGRPSQIFVWGARVPIQVKLIRWLTRSRIIFVEDAFLRSAALGKLHSTPLSLAFDESSVHYNARRDSDLIKALKSLTLSTTQRETAKTLIRYLKEHQLFKYNDSRMETDFFDDLGVGVLCQNPDDQSLKYGDPSKTSQLKLIRAACKENPGKKIFVRMHPDRPLSYLTMLLLPKSVVICDPRLDLGAFFNRFDHCYTVLSLSGFEALLRGKKVTVFGKPFYSGWGLTDDRYKKSDRGVKLKLEELFWGAYVEYPTYLARGRTKDEQLLNTAKIIQADRDLLMFSAHSVSNFSKLQNKKQLISTLKYWNSRINEPFAKLVMLAALRSTLKQGLLDSGKKILDDIFWRCDRGDAYDHIFRNKPIDEPGSEHKGIDQLESFIRSVARCTPEEISIWELDLLSFVSTNKNILQSLNVASRFCKKVKIFKAAFQIEYLRYGVSDEEKRSPINNQIQLLPLIKFSSKIEMEKLWLNFLKFNTSKVDETKIYIKAINKQYGLDIDPNTALARLDTLFGFNIQFANSLLIQDKLQYANFVAEHVSDLKDITGTELATIARIKSHIKGNSYAADLLERNYSNTKNHDVFKELVRFYIKSADFKKPLKLLNEQLALGQIANENITRRILLGNRDLYNGYKTLLDLPIRKHLKEYFGSKYLEPCDYSNYIPSVFLLPYFGPGDEIHFASYYQKLRGHFGKGCFIRIGCDYRLTALFERSYPHIQFVSVRKPRNFDFLDIEENYTKPEFADILSVIDNNAYDIAEKSRRICMATDLVHYFLPDYDSHVGKAYLKPDIELSKKYREFLPEGKVLVGLNWRSSVVSYMRNEHYLDVSEITPLFDVPNVVFVNLQYGDDNEDIMSLKELYPDKFFCIDGLDLYDDLDGVAALIHCLDLVIAPCTVIVELAGAIGKKSLLFSNSAEINPRKKVASQPTCVWRNDIEIVDAEPLGDKRALVRQVVKRLGEISDQLKVEVKSK